MSPIERVLIHVEIKVERREKIFLPRPWIRNHLTMVSASSTWARVSKGVATHLLIGSSMKETQSFEQMIRDNNIPQAFQFETRTENIDSFHTSGGNGDLCSLGDNLRKPGINLSKKNLLIFNHDLNIVKSGCRPVELWKTSNAIQILQAELRAYLRYSREKQINERLKQEEINDNTSLSCLQISGTWCRRWKT